MLILMVCLLLALHKQRYQALGGGHLRRRLHGLQEVMHSLVGVLLSRNIRAQQVAAAAIADICTAAPRMQGAFLAVRDPS